MGDSIAGALLSKAQSDANGVLVLEFCFSTDDPTFTGHFPTRPLVPGVYQLEIARFAAEQALGVPLMAKEITKSKFLRPIIPGEKIRVELKLSEDADTIHVRGGFSVKGQPAGDVIMRVVRMR